MSILSKRLRQARMSAGLSKSQATKLFRVSAGILHPMLVRFETGAQIPSEAQMNELCRVYGVQREWFASAVHHLEDEVAMDLYQAGTLTYAEFYTWLLLDRGWQMQAHPAVVAKG